MAVGFFNPEALSALGIDTTKWVLQSNSPSKSVQRAQGLKSDGDENASQLYGCMTSHTLVFECHANTGNLQLPDVGKTGGTTELYHLDSFTLSLSQTSWPRLSVQCHIHDDCESGIHSHGTPHRKFSPSLTIEACFGIPDALTAMVGASSAEQAYVGLSSFEYSCSITHVDVAGNHGNYLASDNRDGVENVSVTAEGDIGTFQMTSGNSAIAGWDLTSESHPKQNTSEETSSATFEKHNDTAAPSTT